MRTTIPEKKLAAYRLNPITISRLKMLAKSKKVSVNTLVDDVLTDYTKDVKSEDEILAERKATEEFISEFAGIWDDNDYHAARTSIAETRTIRKEAKL